MLQGTISRTIMILHVSNLSLFLLKLRIACLRVQVVDLYWGVDPEEWDSPELQRLRMKLLEECLKTSAGPCFVVSIVHRVGYPF